MSYRNFPGESEALARRWVNDIESGDHWHIGEKVSEVLGKGDTESSPYIAQCGPVRCVAKPSSDGKPRAAIEKIVSDLAYHLELPVLPVILWDRGEKHGSERYMCLIAWAFEPIFTWDEAQVHLTDDERSATAPTFSAMMAFETWISAQDRGGKHTLVNVDTPNSQPSLAFIDYAYSLSHTWDRKDHPDKDIRAFVPLGRDDHVAAHLIEKIEKIDDSLINSLVMEIPLQYLPSEKRDIIINNLIGRRSKLRALLGINEE